MHLVPNLKTVIETFEARPYNTSASYNAYIASVDLLGRIANMSNPTDKNLPEGVPAEAQIFYAGIMTGTLALLSMFQQERDAAALGIALKANVLGATLNMGDTAATVAYNMFSKTPLVVPPPIPRERTVTLAELLAELGFKAVTPTAPPPIKTTSPSQSPDLAELESMFNLPDPRKES